VANDYWLGLKDFAGSPRSMKMFKTMVLSLLCFALCTTITEGKTTVKTEPFGKMPDGTSIEIFTLSDGTVEARIMTYGGILVSLKTPDRNGNSADIVLGFDDLDGYVSNSNGKNSAFFGALVGRYANRIAKGEFTLDGKKYSLPINNAPNSLHGGPHGFNNQVWKGKEIADGVELTYLSKNGEAGYPGALTATVRYTLVKGELKIDYSATTDKDTVLNLTNHSYFNLAGQGKGDILGDQLTLNASKFTPADAGLIPTGELKAVTGTPFDFTKATAVGARIDAEDEQLKLGHGYDHNWVLDETGGKLSQAAEVFEPTSGRVLQVLTDQPGIQFYTGNFLDGTIKGKGGVTYGKHAALCLETQHFPDSPNHPDFPTTELKAGHKYHTVTVFKLSTR
jgi:aldose 1-epimerase